MSNNTLEMALTAAQHGIPVFPANPDNKRPLINGWPEQATTDAEQIKRWWTDNPRAMIGAVMGERSGMFAVDIDTKGELTVEEKQAKLEKVFKLSPATFIVETGTKGRHLYYKMPLDGDVRNSASQLLEGVDVRGTGGYVVFPCSVKSDGTVYSVLSGELSEIADPSPELLAAMKGKKVTGKVSTLGGSSPFSVGRRDNDFASIAGLLRSKGASGDEIAAYLAAIDSTLASPHGRDNTDRISKSIARYELLPKMFTHKSFADHLAKELEPEVRYCEGLGFILYEEGRWVRDPEELGVVQKVCKVCDQVKADIQSHRGHISDSDYESLVKASKALDGAPFISNALKFFKANEQIKLPVQRLDADKNLLCLSNGTLELGTLTLRQHSPSDYLTHKLDFAYDPKAACPIFTKFLSEILSPDVAAFWLRVMGYALLGSGREQRFFICHGTGKNGKSTMLEVILSIFGPMAVNVQPDSLNGRLDGSIRNDIARLMGARLMVTSETKSGTVLDAPLMKQITGQDALAARFLHKEFFEFRASCVPIIITNYLPVLDGADTAMRRRISVVEFNRVIEVADVSLPEKLVGERQGIFNLLLSGMREYLESGGLKEPASVTKATAIFVDQSNLMKGFFDDCIKAVSLGKVSAATVYKRYDEWCKASGYKAMSSNQFKVSFERQAGLEQQRDANGRYWSGIALKSIF